MNAPYEQVEGPRTVILAVDDDPAVSRRRDPTGFVVAGPVGERAMAVMLVHRYLEKL